MNEISLFIDESGNLGSQGRFFLICALEVQCLSSKTVSRRISRLINKYKKRKLIPKSKELKGWSIKEEDRFELITKILSKDIKVRYIVLDKEKATILLKKGDDKNACYNYLVQLLVKRIIKTYNYIDKINLYLDNRSVKIGNRLSLKPYLYNKLILEQLEKKDNIKRVEFEINYLESESCYLIQGADIICNSIFKKYNSNNNIFYKKIKPYIIFESKFPSRNFGK